MLVRVIDPVPLNAFLRRIAGGFGLALLARGSLMRFVRHLEYVFDISGDVAFEKFLVCRG